MKGMKRKNTLIIIGILFFINSLAFSQVENPYVNFNPEQLKNKKEYTRNFNPGNYSTKVLYDCMIEMVDLARKEYSFVGPMKHDIRLDSTAQMQANYQASKNEKTDLNQSPYKTLNFRLKKYGLSSKGVELVSKAKATLGSQEYSYYDLCLELIRPVLKAPKSAKVLLDKQYTYIGFGYETDEYMKSMYASFVLGNDRIFIDNQPAPTAKNLPYTKGRAGISDYDDKICQKTRDDFSLEQLSNFISVKGDEVIFTCDNAKILRKMIGKEGDAIVLDFVQHSQYRCGSENMIDHDKAHRGFVSKPIVLQKILDANEITDKKANRVLATIAQVPPEVNPDEDFDINIIILKEKKYACRTILKKRIETKNSSYEEKMNFLKDENTIKSAGEWVATAEQDVIEFKIPFNSTKLDYRLSDFDTAFSGRNDAQYRVDKIEIVAYHSLNHVNDANQMKNQKRRAESIAKALAGQFPNVPADIKYEDTWEDFKKDIVYNDDYYDLALLTKDEAVKKIKENNGRVAKEIEPFLAKHRYAKIILHITYEIDGNKEQEFSVAKFNKAIESKNLPLAMAVQKYIMKQVENKKYTIEAANKMLIPENKEHQPFLLNKLYIRNYLSPKMTDKIRFDMKNIYALDNTNPVANFNMAVVDVNQATFNAVNDINVLQATIDRLYTMTSLPKERINSLNLELQFKVIDYLVTVPASTETENQLTLTYNKIKSVRNPKLDSWQNAYKLAAYFVKNYDYMSALSLMDPFVNDPDISEDFLFSYISIAAAREETFFSNLFTDAVRIASEKSPARLCGLFDNLPVTVLDNTEVQKIICKNCK